MEAAAGIGVGEEAEEVEAVRLVVGADWGGGGLLRRASRGAKRRIRIM